MSKQPPPAPAASAVGPCPTVLKIVGRPGTGSLPSTIAPPDHPHNDEKSQTDPLFFRIKYHELLSNFPSYEMVQSMVTQLDQPVLLRLIHINVDYLTMPLFFQRRSKLLI